MFLHTAWERPGQHGVKEVGLRVLPSREVLESRNPHSLPLSRGGKGAVRAEVLPAGRLMGRTR